jgi:hypothetical protein
MNVQNVMVLLCDISTQQRNRVHVIKAILITVFRCVHHAITHALHVLAIQHATYVL